MESKSKKLRSGYTTGACAAAAAKAASLLLARNAECGLLNTDAVHGVEIPFPDGTRVSFNVQRSDFKIEAERRIASASVIKDAGDDPDVTHGAEIVATVSLGAESGMQGSEPNAFDIRIYGGAGVGRITKPGLAIPVGEPAINPVPRTMIVAAVKEAIAESGLNAPHLAVTISVPAGEELAKKTLNCRLGIVGGISILGTTGIVKPVSTEAYTASITAGMDVARAMGHTVVVLSSGRTSEKAHMKRYGFADEAYVMMGDYLEYSLQDAKRHGFTSIHLCAQWAKMIKTAMSIPQTHVRHGAIGGNDAGAFLRSRGLAVPDRQFNTAREIYDHVMQDTARRASILAEVCSAAKRYAESVAGLTVFVCLVSYEGEIIAESE